MLVILSVYAFVLGASLASFGCVVAERVPQGLSIGGRSACACGRQLRWFENVPVAGWLACGGRARCCGARLPVRYVVSEAGSGLAAVGLVLVWVAVTGPSWA